MQFGGAIYNNVSDVSLVNCSLLNNNASDGGALYNDNSSPTLTNCSLTGNSAPNGGAMFSISDDPTLTNCVVWGNGVARAIYNQGGALTTASYCLFDAAVTGDTTDPTNLTTTVSPFVSTTPGTPAGLALNGCAPAINAGSNEAYSTAGGPPTDLLGNTRIVGSGTPTGRIDMGAVEFQGTPNTVAFTQQPASASTLCVGSSVAGQSAALRPRLRSRRAGALPVRRSCSAPEPPSRAVAAATRPPSARPGCTR